MKEEKEHFFAPIIKEKGEVGIIAIGGYYNNKRVSFSGSHWHASKLEKECKPEKMVLQVMDLSSNSETLYLKSLEIKGVHIKQRSHWYTGWNELGLNQKIRITKSYAFNLKIIEWSFIRHWFVL